MALINPVNVKRNAPDIWVGDTGVGTPWQAADIAGGNDTFNNAEGVFIMVQNTDAVNDLTVTIETNKTYDGLTLPDNGPHTLNAGECLIAGPFPKSAETAGVVQVTYGGTAATARIAVCKLLPKTDA